MKEMIKKYSGTLICSVLVMLAGVLVGFTCTQSIYTHASCHSITQLDSRHFFQIGALPGQRRWGDMKLLRRPCNILPPRDHKEVIQRSKFHIDPFCPVFSGRRHRPDMRSPLRSELLPVRPSENVRRHTVLRMQSQMQTPAPARRSSSDTGEIQRLPPQMHFPYARMGTSNHSAPL